jgi:cytochrome P450
VGLPSWTLLLLARHPNEFAKLRTEIIADFDFGSEASRDDNLNFTSPKACKPLTHVLYEAFQLYPLVSMNSRMALKDTCLPTGGGPDRKRPIAVMKGEQAGYSAYVMQRRHDIWGEDAGEFRPARWEGRKLGWDFIAFRGGPRVCLGRKSSCISLNFLGKR